MGAAKQNEQTVEQPDSFEFTKANLEKAKAIIAKYPEGKQKSAVMPLLDLAQRQHGGWIPRAAIEYIADFLEMAPIRVYEVASFYTMYNLKPVGTHFIQVCRTTPCWLRGADTLTQHCKKKLGVDIGEVSKDGQFSMIEVECLGACVNAPMVQINDDFYEDLTPELLDGVLDDLVAGKKPKVGTQIKRQNSAPEGGATTLKKVKK